MSTRTANAAKQTVTAADRKARRTGTAAKPAAAPKTTAKRTRTTSKPAAAQKSVTVQLDRAKEPKGNGGVRFEERAAKDGSTALRVTYIDQSVDALLGKPKTLEITIKAGK